MRPSAIPRWLKAAHTGFVVVLIPHILAPIRAGQFPLVFRRGTPNINPALWLESSLLANTQAVGLLVPEAVWLIDFGAGLLTGKTPIGLAGYMFDRRLGRFVRAVSLFHLWLTPILLIIVSRAGYDHRSPRHQTILTWLTLIASWRLTRPEDNVN